MNSVFSHNSLKLNECGILVNILPKIAATNLTIIGISHLTLTRRLLSTIITIETQCLDGVTMP